MLDFKPYTNLINNIVGLLTIGGALRKIINLSYKWILKPKVLFGFFDNPSPNDVCYYILVKSIKNDIKQKIVLSLNPHLFQLYDYTISVNNFQELPGISHNDKVKIIEKEADNTKILEFDLEPNKPYRITIHTSGYQVGRPIYEQYDLSIQATDATVKIKHHKFPMTLTRLYKSLF